MTTSLTPTPNFAQFLFELLTLNGTKCIKERLMNKDDKNRHFVPLIIDISKHGANEMGQHYVKMAGPGFVNDVTA